jgi:ATP-dependent Clp protease ATP-binding subunit ClpA
MSRELQNEIIQTVISNAQALAVRNRHEFVTLDHLLMVLLKEESVKAILRDCKVNEEAVRADTEQALLQVPKLPEDQDMTDSNRIMLTPAFYRVIQNTVKTHVSSGREILEHYHMLVPFFDEKSGTVALSILLRNGLKREELVRVISHGKRKLGNQKAEAEDALSTYTVDLTQKAIKGQLDPLIGRDKEIERLVQVLGRRRKNNPLLVGDPGVGKTALAEGLAQRIVSGAVPERLREYKLHSLNMGAMIAGTKYRGDFEERWKVLLDQLAERPEVVLFIDEIHTLVGGGGGKGAMDAANLIKPALSSGNMRLVGSTTFEEYRSIFEQDAALARRFQKIDVVEPSPSETVQILRGLVPQLESHHKLSFAPEALEAAVRLSVRYQPEKRLPDKAIDLLDEAASRLRSHSAPLDGDTIGEREIEATLSSVANIPIERATATDRTSLADLRPRLDASVFGQEKATETVAAAMVMSKAGLGHPNRPMGSFLFTGPTGVGKTETARQLADVMGMKLIRFDMSEYMESHAVSRLIGAPPGYVGYNEGGLLTEQVNQCPHAVLLLDEIEKAHPSIFNLLLQVMDAGRLTDTNGRTVDFRHVVLIMTTNAGGVAALKPGIGFLKQDTRKNVDEALSNVFPPEFRNRLDAIVQFQALGSEEVQQVVRKFISQISSQVVERGVSLSLSEEAVQWLAKEGFDPMMGARPLDRAIQEHVKKPLASAMLFGALENGGVALFDINQAGDGLVLTAREHAPIDAEIAPVASLV